MADSDWCLSESQAAMKKRQDRSAYKSVITLSPIHDLAEDRFWDIALIPTIVPDRPANPSGYLFVLWGDQVWIKDGFC